MEILIQIKDALNAYVWGWPTNWWPNTIPLIVILLLGSGIVVTFRLRFIQITGFLHGWGLISGKYDKPEHDGDISHFQALTAALSATVGIGNIAGVATAIHYGGPGALFWMWLSGFFGMALKYNECTLAQMYRKINPDGSVSGGPMYYIEMGLGGKWKALAILFGFCTVVSSFGSGNMVQAFTMADQFRSQLGIPTIITGAFSAVVVGFVIIGGIKRIGKVTSILCPVMAVFYVSAGLLVLVVNITALPAALVTIVSEAFQPRAEVTGIIGGGFIVFLNTMVWGVKRGLFSNEAGQGSAPIAHSAAKTDMPVREGTVALLGPFIDTLTICTITGLIIITTGAYQEKFEDQIQYGVKASITVAKPDQSLDLPRIQEVPDKLLYQGPLEIKDGIPQNVVLIYNHATIEEPRFYKNDSLFSGKFDVDKLNRIKESNGEVASFWIKGRAIQNGSPLTTSAFNKGLAFLGSNVIGSFLVTISVFLFAISTAISWSYYGDRATQYLWGNWAILPYKFVYMGMNFLGAIFSLELVWGFGDVALGIMTIPNLIAVNLLTRRVKRETDKYYQQKSW